MPKESLARAFAIFELLDGVDHQTCLRALAIVVRHYVADDPPGLMVDFDNLVLFGQTHE